MNATRTPAPVGPDQRLRDAAAGVLAAAGSVSSAIVIGENGNADLHFAAGAGPLGPTIAGARGPAKGSGLSGTVLELDEPVLVPRARGDDRVHQGHSQEMGIDTCMGAPLRHDGRPFAMLMALDKAAGGAFDEADLARLMRYAESVQDAVWASRDAT